MTEVPNGENLQRFLEARYSERDLRLRDHRNPLSPVKTSTLLIGGLVGSQIGGFVGILPGMAAGWLLGKVIDNREIRRLKSLQLPK